MAQEKIIINFKAAGNKALVAAVRELDNAIRDLKNETRKYGKEGGKWVKNNRLLDNSFATLRSKILLFNFAMAMGVRQLIQFAQAATKVQSMERAFNNLSGGTENATSAMDKLEKATNGTMSRFDLFQQANNAMILGVTKNADEMAEMFDIAQRLGNALGRDTKSSVESLITGIGRQSRMMLDNIGIVVKVDKANQKYADSLRITVDQLTDAQRKQAFLTATMEAARKGVARTGQEVVTSQMKFNDFGASMDNLQVEIGTAFIPTLETFAVVFTKVADAIDADNIQRFATAAAIAAASFGLLSGNIQKAARAMLSFNVAQTKTGWGAIAAGIGFASFAALEYFGVFEGGKETIEGTNYVLSRQNEEFEKNRKHLLAAAELKNKLALSSGELMRMETNALDVEIQQHLIQSKRNQAHELYNDGLISAADLALRINNLEIESIKLEEKAELALFKTKMDIGAKGLKAAAGLLAINKKNAKEVALLQAGAALVSAYAAAQDQFATVSKIAPPPFPQIAYAAAIAMGIAQAAQVTKAAGVFEQGGLVGGRRHSQGGTMIEAEQGEFVMNRNAVQSIGLENLNAMNQSGGGGAINVSISGNVMSQDFVEGELAEQIKEAVRRGTDFGIG